MNLDTDLLYALLVMLVGSSLLATLSPVSTLEGAASPSIGLKIVGGIGCCRNNVKIKMWGCYQHVVTDKLVA
jgi:hypothetical protein